MSKDGQPGGVRYRDIADEVRQLIDSGELPPGAKVPGENDLMSRFGVERMTARRALDVLKNEGLVVPGVGRGRSFASSSRSGGSLLIG